MCIVTIHVCWDRVSGFTFSVNSLASVLSSVNYTKVSKFSRTVHILYLMAMNVVSAHTPRFAGMYNVPVTGICIYQYSYHSLCQDIS